ncbi:MAG: LysR substrate-binding domain-containing protein [Casimicrobium sp.]
MNRNDNRFPSIESLRAFEAITRLGSYEKVAQELAITASAVSKRIAALESLLGVALLDRSGRVLALSAAGKEYLDQVREVLTQLAAIGLHRRAVQTTPRLRVLTPPTFAREILVPRLKAFTDRHPKCEIEVVVAIPYLDMAVPESDVAVSFGPRFASAHGRAHDREPLLFEDVFAVASSAFVKKHRLRKPEDVLRVPLVRCPIEPWRPWFAAAGIDSDEPTRGVKLVDLGLSITAAASSQGVALARASIAKRWLDLGEVVDVFDIRATPQSGYSLTVHRADDVALDFAQWLRGVCAKLERGSR